MSDLTHEARNLLGAGNPGSTERAAAYAAIATAEALERIAVQLEARGPRLTPPRGRL